MSKRRPRTQEEFADLLVEQLAFLESSAEAFDQGFEGEAKRMAVCARILLHDTSSSHSLLGLLGKRDVAFVDTALPNEASNELPYGGLVFVGLGGENDKYVAMLDDVPKVRNAPLDEWWTAEVFRDDRGNSVSRRDLVLTVSNQDGGAHVDSSLDETYARLSRENSMGWVVADASGSRPLPGPDKAAIRQIAHEILKTLKPGYEKTVDHNVGMIVGGFSVSVGPVAKKMTPSRPSAKVGRNEKCPCGSGKKYKKCHGKIV